MLSFNQGRSSSAQVKAAPCLEAEVGKLCVVFYTEGYTNSFELR